MLPACDRTKKITEQKSDSGDECVCFESRFAICQYWFNQALSVDKS